MKPIQIGEILIERVIDQVGAPLPFGFVYPNADWDVCGDHADWLAPDHIDLSNQMVLMNYHSYVVRTGRSTILIEACIGNDKDRATSAAFHMQNSQYIERLAEIGLRPEDIDVVMCSHLHPDHTGWNTKLVDGSWVPTFPNARYVFGKEEYDYWETRWQDTPENPFFAPAFLDSVLPVIDSGQAEFVASDHELERGVWLEPGFGHSPGHIMINVDSNGQDAVFSGDIIHHPVQLADPSIVPFFDQDAEMAMATRMRLLDRVTDTKTVVLPAHFCGTSAGHVVSHGDAYRYQFTA